MRKPVYVVSHQARQKRAVPPQKMDRGLKFRISHDEARIIHFISIFIILKIPVSFFIAAQTRLVCVFYGRNRRRQVFS